MSKTHLWLFKNFVCAESCDWLSPWLLGAAQQVWADMRHGECLPDVQHGRRSKETHISPTSREDLQGGAAVFNGECAHAAEPFTNEHCSVIGFTYVVGAERPREANTHTHTHAHTHTHTHAHTHARIRNRPPPVGGKDTNTALRCPGAWGHFSQPQSCCRLHASATSKQHPVACIPKSRKTSCSLALLICPSILLVHIGISV